MSYFTPFMHLGASFLSYVLAQWCWWSRASKATADKPHRPLLDSTGIAQYDMHLVTGFLPPQPPLDRLPEDYELWESALASASSKLSLGEDHSSEALSRRESSSEWRQQFHEAPVLETDDLLGDVRLLHRAHHVLAYLVHMYVQSIPPPLPNAKPQPLHVPASLAVPLVAVSDALGIAPILTFADTVLWNWGLKDPDLPISPDNLRCKTTFSGTPDEENFYVCCASVELRGVEALRIILDYQNMASLHDEDAIEKVTDGLGRLAQVIGELKDILRSVRNNCEPHVFYFGIRPWFRGSDADGAESPGWIYDGVENTRQLELSGPSAGQSSLMHALDVFLDVDHQLSKARIPAPTEHNKKADQSFMVRMRKYMPGKHQDFLRYLSSHRMPIRNLAKEIPELREPYDTVVRALKEFRDFHMRIACLYIVSMARSEAARAAGCPLAARMEKLQRENAAIRQPPRGTGGNELSCLLKATRDATKRTVIAGNID